MQPTGTNQLSVVQYCFESSGLTEPLDNIKPDSLNELKDICLSFVDSACFIEEWVFYSETKYGFALNLPTTNYSDNSFSDAFEELLNSDVFKRTFKRNSEKMNCHLSVATFNPSISAVPTVLRGTTGITYTVSDFCLGSYDSIDSIPTKELENRILESLREQSRLVYNREPLCLGNQYFCASNFSFKEDSVYTRVAKGREQTYCTIEFSLNVDIVGPFLFDTVTQDCLPTKLESKVFGPQKYIPNLDPNPAAFGELFSERLGNAEEFLTQQNLVAIYVTECEDYECLESLSNSIAQYIIDLSQTFGIPPQVFELEPKIEGDRFYLAIALKTSDHSLIREFHHCVNEVRLNDHISRSKSMFFNSPVLSVMCNTSDNH